MEVLNMKKISIKIRLVGILIIMTLLFGFSTNVFAYDQAGAQTYAGVYWNPPNPNYQVMPDNDCANFVSQCLYEGGKLPMYSGGSDWNYYHHQYWWEADSWSLSWTVADDLKNFMKNNLQAQRLSYGWSRYGGNGFLSYLANNDDPNIYGLGSEVIFYDFGGEGRMDHTAIVVGTGWSADSTGYGDLVCAHTSYRYKSVWHLDSYNALRESTQIYAFRIVGY
jgi:hypothetical protein